jgi:hypothetical protein
MAAARLDGWMESPEVRTHRRRSADASPDALWRAANELRLDDTRRLGRLVRWRIPDLARDLTYHDLFRAYPFTVLEEEENLLVAGLCGRIWTLARDYPRLDGPESFREWNEPGTVRVLFGHWVQRDAEGRAELVSEARVTATDRSAALRLRALWTVIGGFEPLVAAEPLTLATRRAERR